MKKTIALVPIDLRQTRFGLPSMLLREIGGATILDHMLRRLSRIASIDSIVLVHPAEQDIASAIDTHGYAKPVHPFAFKAPTARDPQHAARLAGRKWSLHSWRGGLGSSSCYDELLPAGPLAAAMRAHDADAALLAGGDWAVIDPVLCEQVIARHYEAPQSMKMVFTQAPPGLAGIALARDLVEHMAQMLAGFGHMLGYVPTKAQPDPIGLDVCVQIPATVRATAHRFIGDTPRSFALLEEIGRRGGDRFTDADASLICEWSSRINLTDAFLPEQVTLELTPQREVTGPITPQHYAQLDRPPIDFDAACRIIEQVGDARDVALMLGGLGDALLHPRWVDLVNKARAAGVFAIGIETDLLVDMATLRQLLDAPIDLIAVRLNADTAAMYRRVMGADRFAQVTGNMQWLLTERQRRAGSGDPRAGLPWIVPRMVKTNETLADMETFFDRWVHFTGHAVIEPAMTGRRGALPIAPPLSPVRMSPPKRIACRQMQRRISILSDATVTLCDQDWHGGDVVGDATITPLIELWNAIGEQRGKHAGGQWHELAMCAGCDEWHRP